MVPGDLNTIDHCEDRKLSIQMLPMVNDITTTQEMRSTGYLASLVPPVTTCLGACLVATHLEHPGPGVWNLGKPPWTPHTFGACVEMERFISVCSKQSHPISSHQGISSAVHTMLHWHFLWPNPLKVNPIFQPSPIQLTSSRDHHYSYKWSFTFMPLNTSFRIFFVSLCIYCPKWRVITLWAPQIHTARRNISIYLL